MLHVNKILKLEKMIKNSKVIFVYLIFTKSLKSFLFTSDFTVIKIIILTLKTKFLVSSKNIKTNSRIGKKSTFNIGNHFAKLYL